MFDFNGENLQVGDKVIVYVSYFSSKSYYVGTVVKRTPTGLLDIEWGNGKKERFKSNGYEYHRSSGYGRTSLYLEPYTEERGRQVIQENKRKCMVGWLKEFDYTKLSYEEAEQVYTLVTEVKRDKETRPLRIRESRSQMYLAFELARFNKNIEKAREEAEK